MGMYGQVNGFETSDGAEWVGEWEIIGSLYDLLEFHHDT